MEAPLPTPPSRAGPGLACCSISLTNTVRFLSTIVAAVALLLVPGRAEASGAVLAPAGAADPATLDVELAVAVTPFGATRWVRLSAAGPGSVLWLVPARPGAALDWASEGWLTALEDATSPRIAPPPSPPPCGTPSTPERIGPWSSIGERRFPRDVAVHASADEARAYAAGRGFDVSADVGAKIADVYAKGYVLVSIELDTSGAATVSSPTLRISDDGGAVIPLALTGSKDTDVHVTALVLGEGPASVTGARDLDAGALLWGHGSSGYVSARATTLASGAGAVWLRESASHEVLFDGFAVPGGPAIEPLSATYFREATGLPQQACADAARAAASDGGRVGACARGGRSSSYPAARGARRRTARSIPAFCVRVGR